MSFNEFELDTRLLKGVLELGFTTPTLIQQAAIPLALAGKDIVANAKTAAYCLPILQKILAANSNNHSIRALILVPSKELASQVLEFLQKVTVYCQKDVRLFNACLSDGLLKSEQPDIVVSTPTKFINIIQSQNYSIKDTLESLVVDEADLILSFGYEEDLQKLCSILPKVIQSFLFSATLSCDIDKLKVLLVRNPATIKIEDDEEEDLLTQYYLKCTDQDKFLVLYFLLKLKVHPFGTGKSIIFVNDIDRAYKLKLFLEQFGVKTCLVNSELPFKSRHHICQEFNKGLYNYLIATDQVVLDLETPTDNNDNDDKSTSKKRKAKQPNSKKGGGGDQEFGVARGIDFVNVQSVINFDLPMNLRGYLHRVGRTARGVGNKGFAISFVEKRKIVVGDNSKKINVDPTKEEIVFEKIKRKQEKREKEILSFNIDMEQVEAFRYRIEDALRIVTKVSVKDARLKEIKQELLNSEKLKAHFEDNPRDLEALRHDKPIHPTKIQSHMKHIPTYLIPTRKVADVTENETKSILAKTISTKVVELEVLGPVALVQKGEKERNAKKRKIAAASREVGLVTFDANKQAKKKDGYKNYQKRKPVDSLKSFSVDK